MTSGAFIPGKERRKEPRYAVAIIVEVTSPASAAVAEVAAETVEAAVAEAVAEAMAEAAAGAVAEAAVGAVVLARVLFIPMHMVIRIKDINMADMRPTHMALK